MLLNSIKRYLSFFLAIALMFSCLPVSALAAEDYLPEENHRAEGSALESTGEEAVVDATAETTAASVETAEEKLLRLQAEMNTILIKYLGATALSEEEIIDIVVNMPWTDMEAALADKARLELDFSSLTEAEIDALNAAYTGAASIACFYETIEATMTPAFFATSGTHTPVTGITVSVSGATDNSMSSGNVTVTAKGSGGLFGIGASAKTATITIKNDTAESSTIAFDWTASSVNELKIDGTVYTGTSGNFSKLFTAGASITVTITTAKNGTTNKLVMNNFSLTKASTAYNVKFISDSGSISVNGETVASGTTKPITAAGSTLSTSASNFVAWINAESRELLSQNSSYTLQPKADMTVRAVISTNAWFLVNGKYVYDDLNAAVSHTGASIVVLLNSGTLVPSTSSDGVYTIPSTVTLLIPFDAAHTLITNDMEKHVASSNDTQTLFRQLIMPSGTSITVNGAISISSRASRQMVGQVGPYGAIVMDEGSSISIENGASLYAYGYIFAGTDGAGMITVKDGGTVYEDIMSLDYPGSLSSTIDLFNDYKIFPLRSFSIRNVEVPMTLNSGAKEYVFYCIYSGTFKKNFPGTELVISSDSSSPFQLKEGTTLTKSYSGGKQYVKINGSGGLNPLSVTLQGTTISSEDTTGFPIPSGFDIELASGTITMGGHVIMTEGSKITIGSEATVEANGKNLYVLDATEDAGAVSKTDVHKTQYTQVNSDAVLDVNGVLNAGATFYTSTSGACITSSKGGGKINIATAPADTKVYVKMSTSSQKNIEVTSAQLLNANGSYVETAKEGAGTYYYAHGLWHKTDTKPIVTSKPTAPTCTEKGYTTHTCSSCDYKVVDSYVDATGHSYSKNTPSSKIVTKATCIAAATYYVQCDNCDYVNTNKTVAAGEVNPNNHTGETYLSGKVDATCTEPGYSGDTHCGGCKQKLSDGNTVSALGHTPAAAVQENVKKATCLEPGSYDSVIYCSVSNCGAELSRTTISVPAAGHTYVDGKCSVCGCVEVSFTIAHNLALKELVQIGYWVKAESAAEIKDVGVLIWKEADYFAEDKHDISSDTAVNPAMTSRQGFMMGYGEGIYAQYLDTKYYAVPYVVTSDGSYVYSGTPDVYAAPTYALQMGNQPEKVKTVVRDLLNYGTYAQLYFDSRPDGDIDTSTRINDVLEDAQKKLRYSDTMLVEEITADKTAENTNLSCTWRYSTAELLDAIQLNFFADRSSAFTNMLHWNETDYTAANTMKKDNATTVLNIIDKSIVEGDITVCGSISGIYPKNLTKWHYACMYNSADNTYGPLRVDSVACYLSRMISNLSKYAGQESEYGYLLETCKAMLAYGDSAKTYAGS